jgi:hypothetical protein
MVMELVFYKGESRDGVDLRGLLEHIATYKKYVSWQHDDCSTYPGMNIVENRVHNACVESEKKGRIHRISEEVGRVGWKTRHVVALRKLRTVV